jgi:hypothetical protein
MTTKTNYPKAFSHIGITVPNIKRLNSIRGNGLVHYYGTIHSQRKETAIGQMCIDVLVKIGNLKLRI